jgi:hypothetical protein
MPKAKPSDRIERMLKCNDPLTLLSALQRNRWNRKRRLLPRLKLRYPTDDELRSIAKLAVVDDVRLFGQSLCSGILDAHLYHAQLHKLSTPRVRGVLQSVSKLVQRLTKELGKLDVGRGSGGSEDYVGYKLESELAHTQRDPTKMILIPEYIDLLNVLSSAAQRAERKPMNLLKGAGGNPAFDLFIHHLLMAARMRRGQWTIFRSRDQTWKGTLLKALEILKPYLPKSGFFPSGLGRSVDHIRWKLEAHMKRTRQRLGRSGVRS